MMKSSAFVMASAIIYTTLRGKWYSFIVRIKFASRSKKILCICRRMSRKFILIMIVSCQQIYATIVVIGYFIVVLRNALIVEFKVKTARCPLLMEAGTSSPY